MIEVAIPGRGTFVYDHLVLDFNGTLACDGVLLTGVAGRLRSLSAVLVLHVVTADTFGTASGELAGVPLNPTVLGPEEQAEAKAALVERLGARRTVAIGNGANDAAMLKIASLGIVVDGSEGCARETLLAADVVVPDLRAALDLLLKPERLIATLRR